MKRAPDFVVGPQSSPYLLRWWLVPRNKLANVYLHEFVGDDDDRALHDHPWHSLSVVISGGYYEITIGPDGTYERRWYGAGSILFRRPKFAHRIELSRRDGGLVPCRTLFLTGPRVREWGFLCPQGWRHWKEFCDERDFGQVGRGCE